ncbi:hypothetical protein FDI40_gp455 [Agrobacterium phage Atu_ph07]|uniref:Uncharacterized protein n=1 Tax=Agrobacterium phage Atu_ph07 TaxID=2024264 RepID=A0A2L0V089_9CAUD|nr:hypothetical protein FDI40_gp455 [Agrobacterium phage Atu_ph07]AUZ95214.1 hypothetical protein [Agrobacterium phage Atu_ph07]
MKLAIQLKVTKKEAERFINGLETQGYVAHRIVNNPHVTDVHFTLDGKTSLNYSVTFGKGYTYLGIRPE